VPVTGTVTVQDAPAAREVPHVDVGVPTTPTAEPGVVSNPTAKGLVAEVFLSVATHKPFWLKYIDEQLNGDNVPTAAGAAETTAVALVEVST